LQTGTGKSVLLRAIIDHFGGGPSNRLAITASTGIAAVNIGGCTLHSWAGIGLGKESETKLYYKLWNCEPVKDRWQLVKTLIIDESNRCFLLYIPGKCLIILLVSMIDGTLFDKLVRL
jgi:ATP-dependent DNA helicase PIF1